MSRILAVNGSYRDDGITDQLRHGYRIIQTFHGTPDRVCLLAMGHERTTQASN